MSTPDLNSQPRRPLDERNFVQEQPNPYPFWLWLALLAIAAALLWGMGSWYQRRMGEQVATSPFLQVTNRQFSLFLWQFPEFMRTHASVKEGYLPGFQYKEGKVGIESGQAEAYVIAPPDVIFLYHVWSRLIRSEFAFRNFSGQELVDFLKYAPEWLPEQWPEAPASYRTLVVKLSNASSEELSETVPTLPVDVEIAITGWKNYMQEGEAIDKLAPTYQQLVSFLERNPHYARNYWRNIVVNQRTHYLETLSSGKYILKNTVPANELTGFLKIALYNDEQAHSQPEASKPAPQLGPSTP